jgi:hypothetical protein
MYGDHVNSDFLNLRINIRAIGSSEEIQAPFLQTSLSL